jgi:hypothetical protein
MKYHLTLIAHPRYLHAAVVGTHSVENVARFLREVREACARRGVPAVLLEVNFSGPSLATGSIFSVISQESAEGRSLRKVAYVDPSDRDPAKIKFAETVALNRGVNVRLFASVEEAGRWLEE